MNAHTVRHLADYFFFMWHVDFITWLYYVVPVFCVIVTFLSRDYVMLYLISVLSFTFWLCCVTNIFTYDCITTADIIYWQYISYSYRGGQGSRNIHRNTTRLSQITSKLFSYMNPQRKHLNEDTCIDHSAYLMKINPQTRWVHYIWQLELRMGWECCSLCPIPIYWQCSPCVWDMYGLWLTTRHIFQTHTYLLFYSCVI